MAQRSVVIQLSRPQYAANWWRGTQRLIREHRDEIFSDIGWFLSQTRKSIKKVIRWDEWSNKIVKRPPHPDAVIDLLIKHQGDIDEDDATAEDVVDYFEAQIRERLPKDVDISRRRYFVSSILANEWVTKMNRRFEGNPSAYLKQVEHPRHRYWRTDVKRGFLWSGRKAKSNAPYFIVEYSPRKDQDRVG